MGRQPNIGQRIAQHAQTAASIAGAAHTAWQIGKGLYGLAQAAAPYAAMLKTIVMGLQMHARRAMQRVAGAAKSVATHAVRGIDAARPIYEIGRAHV